MSSSTSRRSLFIAVLFLAPNLLGFLVFTLGPIVLSLAGSFTTWSLRPSVPLKFIGFRNYLDLFSDPNFYFYFFQYALHAAGAAFRHCRLAFSGGVS